MESIQRYIDLSASARRRILKKVLREGSGMYSPTRGCTVYVHYTSTFYGGNRHGEQFDLTRDRGETYSFTLGENEAIEALDVAVATMKKGDLCQLICTGSIPANATLKFEVELFGWKGKDISNDKDGSLTQSIIVIGSGFYLPKDCAIAEILIKGSFNDVVFDERDVEFEICDCESYGLVAGISMAVKKMKKNERSVFEIGPQHAFGYAGSAEFNIPPEATVSYEITLTEFEDYWSSEQWIKEVEGKETLAIEFLDQLFILENIWRSSRKTARSLLKVPLYLLNLQHVPAHIIAAAAYCVSQLPQDNDLENAWTALHAEFTGLNIDTLRHTIQVMASSLFYDLD